MKTEKEIRSETNKGSGRSSAGLLVPESLMQIKNTIRHLVQIDANEGNRIPPGLDLAVQ